MVPIIKISAVKRQMKDKPSAQRLYTFFYEGDTTLTKAQIKDIKKIVDREYKKLTAYLDEAISA